MNKSKNTFRLMIFPPMAGLNISNFNLNFAWILIFDICSFFGE